MGMFIVYMTIIGDVLSGTWSEGAQHSGVIEEWFGQHWWSTRFILPALTMFLVFAAFISFNRVIHPIKNELKDPTHKKSIVWTWLSLCSDIYILHCFKCKKDRLYTVHALLFPPLAGILMGLQQKRKLVSCLMIFLAFSTSSIAISSDLYRIFIGEEADRS